MKLTHRLTVFLVVFLLSLVSVFAQNVSIDTNMKNTIAKYEGKILTDEILKRALKEMGIKHPDEVFNQAILESGHFKSKLAIKGNNLFGMRKPGKRLTFALKDKIFGYAKYLHWIYSVADYKLWQDISPIKPGEKYKHYLKRRKYNNLNEKK